MTEIKKELDALGEEIEEKKREKAQKEGSISTLYKQLKDEVDLNSTKEAEKEMAKLSKEFEKIDKEIEEDFEKLKEVYNVD